MWVELQPEILELLACTDLWRNDRRTKSIKGVGVCADCCFEIGYAGEWHRGRRRWTVRSFCVVDVGQRNGSR